jgi:hypothetical protein
VAPAHQIEVLEILIALDIEKVSRHVPEVLFGRGHLVGEDKDVLSMRNHGQSSGIVPWRQYDKERVAPHVPEAQMDSHALGQIEVPILSLDRAHNLRPKGIPAGNGRSVEISLGLEEPDDFGVVLDVERALDETAVPAWLPIHFLCGLREAGSLVLVVQEEDPIAHPFGAEELHTQPLRRRPQEGILKKLVSEPAVVSESGEGDHVIWSGFLISKRALFKPKSGLIRQKKNPKTFKKRLDIICRPDRNAVIRLNYHVMNTHNAVSRPQIRRRCRPFRSLLVAVAGALILTSFLAPRANATLLVYFNFEDGTLPTKSPPTPGVVDFTSDQTVAAGGDNPGGGIQMSLLTTNYPAGDFGSVSSLIPIGTTNQSAGDTDVPPATPGIAVNFNRSDGNNGTYIQFAVNATFFTNMSLSYAVNTNGNGFTTQTWNYSINGGATFTQFAQFTGLTGLQTLSATLPAGANNQPGLVIQIVFSGGQSNGVDDQTIIDNIQLNGVVIPEPATVMGGLLGVSGLCWHQRRRLIRFLRFRPA